jgi:cyclopropane-fatty-acyl-phospholipid synthase
MSVLFASEEIRDRADTLIQPDAIGLCETSKTSFIDRMCRNLVLRRLENICHGKLTISAINHNYEFGDGIADGTAILRINSPRFWRRAVSGGGLGAADAYINGDWDSDDLVGVMSVFARNMDVLTTMERGLGQLLRPLRVGMNWLRRNSRSGSRRNIAAHYDLSNDFFALMLDPTMTYSSGIFDAPDATLEQASVAKYDRICRKLELTPQDHVVEVGCGWGGFALYAARVYGCQVTATTISNAQYDFAERRIAEAGLADRITLVRQDYRDLKGQYDKLVSIEMIEAVGEKYLDMYFDKCSDLLKPNGMMLLQAITIPDHRYDEYRGSVDFIQRYIFPGGFLPSPSSIGQSLRRRTDFRLFHLEDIGAHYAKTLSRWRENFWSNIDHVRDLGFDEQFIRTWQYYLCYCEAGFRERQTGVSQILLTKPECRRTDVVWH